MTSSDKRSVNPIALVILGWAVPGAGHLVLGRRDKATLYFILVVGTFIAGWIIAGCQNVYFQHGRWHMFLQMCTGASAFIVGLGAKIAEPKMTVMRLFEIGTLYTMVAGLLNVLVVMDAVVTSIRKKGAAS